MVAAQLARLEAAGRVVRGAFRPGGEGQEWVDAEVLRRLKRRSLAALRKEIEPTDQSALGRFLPAWSGVANGGGSRVSLVEALRQLQGYAIPASCLETDVLAARVAYEPAALDQLMIAGEVVWIGRGPLGARDGRLAVYFRDRLADLYRPVEETGPASEVHQLLRDHLAAHGASFFRDLYGAAGGGDPAEVLDALWDLVWAGEVTNDSLAPVRAFLRGTKAARRGRPALPSSFPPSSAGRWYLVNDLLDGNIDPTTFATGWAEQLLHRHGVVTRDVVASEGFPGGFTGLYPVLDAMEARGSIRRGYFVEGLGGTQFALPGAVDRLRAVKPIEGALMLSAVDPANPYGAALPWPETAGGRAGRSAGAQVILFEGRLAAFVERGGKRVITFGDEALEATAGAIAEAAGRRRRMTLETIDGSPAQATRLGGLLTERGFTVSYRGLTFRR